MVDAMKRVILIIVATLLFFSISFALAERRGWMEPNFISEKLTVILSSPSGKAAVFGAIAGVLLIDLIAPVPSSIVMVVAGVLLGTWLGALASFLGAMAAAWAGYYGCRLGGAKAFDKLVGKTDVKRVESWFEDYGIAAIIISRTVPMLTEILSCLAGLTGVKASTFTVASIVGTLPICIVYAYVGKCYGLDGIKTQQGLVPMIWVTIAIPAVGWSFTHWIKKIRANRQRSEQADA